jgi:hypothetical protein
VSEISALWTLCGRVRENDGGLVLEGLGSPGLGVGIGGLGIRSTEHVCLTGYGIEHRIEIKHVYFCPLVYFVCLHLEKREAKTLIAK